MKTRKHLLTQLILLTAGALGLHAQTVFSENFEGDTPGTQPSATAIRPITNTATNFVEVVTGSANGAGGGIGNGLQLFDNDASTAFVYENNFVADSSSQLSAISVSFDFAWESNLGGGSQDYGRFAVGSFNATTGPYLNQGANTFFEVRFRADGVVLAQGGTDAETESILLDTSYSMDIFINDFDSASIDYIDPNASLQSLGANSFAVYIDGVLLLEDSLRNGALTGDDNLGRMGIVSFTSDVGIDYTMDNYLVNVIPEPNTAALVALGMLGLGLRRRR